jgi:uncharacterized protein
MYKGPCVDCDVHHRWRDNAELISYLPAEWRKYVEHGGPSFTLEPVINSYPHTGGVNKRLDSFPPTGEPPGSDYETLRSQLLEAGGVSRAILSFDAGIWAGNPNPYLASAITSAANDWSIDHWLSGLDDRLYGAVLVAPQVPEEAAKEIRRVGRHARAAEVYIASNSLDKPLGHPIYHPIYAAAAEMNLPIAIHAFTDVLGSAQLAAGGRPSTRLGFFTLSPQGTLHHLLSFITHGVFEKYPSLKLLLVEVGVAWIPWLLWTLEDHAQLLRQESPLLRKRPTDYMLEHVSVTTQPLDLSPHPRQLMDLLRAVDGIEEMLCFATDYPHWDTDERDFVSRRMPTAWLPKIMYRNAARLYGWSPSALEREHLEAAN